MKKPILAPLIFFAAGLACWFLELHAPIGDFGNYYFGSRLFLHHVPAEEIYTPCTFNEHIRQEPGMSSRYFYLDYAPVPPFSLLFYAPLAKMPWPLARSLFVLFTLLFFCFSLFRLLRRTEVPAALAVFLPVIFLLPLRSNVMAGQAWFLAGACLLECWMAEKHPWRAGFFLALAGALKILPLVALLYFVARRQYRVVVSTLIIFLLFCVAGAWAAGPAGWTYFTEIIPRLARNEINDPYATSYQTISVFLKSLLSRDALLNPYPSMDDPLLAEVLTGLFAGAILYLGILAIRKADSLHAFALSLVCGAMLSAYSSVYSLLVFVVPAIVLLQPGRQNRWPFFVLALACFVPVSLLDHLTLPFRFTRAILLLLFFILFLPKSLPVRIPYLLGCMVFFGALRWAMYVPSENESIYFPGQGKELLTCGYRKEENALVLSVIGEYGTEDIRIPCMDSVYSDPALRIEGKRLLFGESVLAEGNDNKMQAMRLGVNEVLYLSDRNRGVGFYALRKIKLPS